VSISTTSILPPLAEMAVIVQQGGAILGDDLDERRRAAGFGIEHHARLNAGLAAGQHGFRTVAQQLLHVRLAAEHALYGGVQTVYFAGVEIERARSATVTGTAISPKSRKNRIFTDSCSAPKK
jgi:hypothetical protein